MYSRFLISLYSIFSLHEKKKNSISWAFVLDLLLFDRSACVFALIIFGSKFNGVCVMLKLCFVAISDFGNTVWELCIYISVAIRILKFWVFDRNPCWVELKFWLYELIFLYHFMCFGMKVVIFAVNGQWIQAQMAHLPLVRARWPSWWLCNYQLKEKKDIFCEWLWVVNEWELIVST